MRESSTTTFGVSETHNAAWDKRGLRAVISSCAVRDVPQTPHIDVLPLLTPSPLPPQDAASRNALAGQEGVSQELAAAQARMKLLETNLAEAHDTVRGGGGSRLVHVWSGV